jgi:predicted amidohydrolase
MKFRIAVVQLKIAQLNPETNLRRMELFVRRAKQKKAQVVVFPEDCVTGILRNRLDLADASGKYRKHFQALARRFRVDLVPGSVIEKTRYGLYNTAYYIDARGRVLGRYQKINLWLAERPTLNFGRRISVFNTRFGRAGLSICWDLAFPELFRRMVRAGAQTVFCPSFWGYSDAGRGQKYNRDAEIRFVDAACPARAFENEIVLVFCNAAGTHVVNGTRKRLIGRSQIAMPFYGALKELNHNREALFVQAVDTAVLKTAEKSYKIRADLKARVLF